MVSGPARLTAPPVCVSNKADKIAKLASISSRGSTFPHASWSQEKLRDVPPAAGRENSHRKAHVSDDDTYDDGVHFPKKQQLPRLNFALLPPANYPTKDLGCYSHDQWKQE